LNTPRTMKLFNPRETIYYINKVKTGKIYLYHLFIYYFKIHYVEVI